MTGRASDPGGAAYRATQRADLLRFAAVDADGPVDDRKQAYGHAFVVVAASSAVAADAPGADALLRDALAVTDARFWDEHEGLSVEDWDRAWTDLEDYRGVNANMHTVDATLGPAAPAGLCAAAVALYDRAVTDGSATDSAERPGFVYTTDWDGTPVVRTRMPFARALADRRSRPVDDGRP